MAAAFHRADPRSEIGFGNFVAEVETKCRCLKDFRVAVGAVPACRPD
jgi:hypothetical protein